MPPTKRRAHNYVTSCCFFAIVALVVDPSSLHAQAATLQDSVVNRAASLFRNIAGRWTCAGGFARGGALASELTFTPFADGRALAFLHADRAPNAYWQSATWSLDAAGHVVSMAMAGSVKTRTGAPALFIATAWSERSITLVADTVKNTPPFAPNQFTYSLISPDSLKMLWELSRGGLKAVGDSLLCGRVR